MNGTDAETVRDRANALKSWIIDECPDADDVALAVPFVHIDALAGRAADAEKALDEIINLTDIPGVPYYPRAVFIARKALSHSPEGVPTTGGEP